MRLILRILALGFGFFGFGFAYRTGRPIAEHGPERIHESLAIAATSLVFFSLALFFEFLSRKFARRSGVVCRRNDKRKPVVFLRPFADDTALQKWQPLRVDMGLAGLFERDLFDSFETLLDREFDSFGPVLCIGDPRRTIQQLGAEKHRPNDWRYWVRNQVQEAQVVLIVPGTSPGIKFEIDVALRPDNFLRTIFVFPPRATQLGKRWTMLIHAIEESAGEWIDLKSLPLEPTPGLFGIRFSSDGRCHVLSEVDNPESTYSGYSLSLHRVISQWRELLQKDATSLLSERESYHEVIRIRLNERAKDNTLDFLRAVDARNSMREPGNGTADQQ